MFPINLLPAGLNQQLVALGEVLASPPSSLIGAQRTGVGRLQHMMLLNIHLRTLMLESKCLTSLGNLGSFLLSITSPQHEDNAIAVV